MLRIYLILAGFLALVATSCETVLEEPYTCENLRRRLGEERAKYNDCQKDDDCILIGAKGGCDCLKAIYGGCGVPIAKKYSQFAKIQEVFLSPECQKSYLCGNDRSCVGVVAVCQNNQCIKTGTFDTTCRP